MLEALLQWDTQLFLWLHHDLTSAWADLVFPLVTDLHKTWAYKHVFVPGLVLFCLAYFRRWGLVFLFALLLAPAASDVIGSKILKPGFDRPRPDVAGLHVNLKSPHFGGRSFPSNHAANMFAVATFLSLVFRKYVWAFFAMAAIVGYSRIYVGVHYPLDVLGGALVGLTTGYLSYLALRNFTRRWNQRLRLGAPVWLKY